MKISAPARSRLILLTLLGGLALALLGCVATGVLVTRLGLIPGTSVRSLRPVASLTCQKYAVTGSQSGSYCAWYMGAATVLLIQAPPEQVFAAYRHQSFLLHAGPVQFAIGAETIEDDNPQPPPLFPIYFGFSLFLEGLP